MKAWIGQLSRRNTFLASVVGRRGEAISATYTHPFLTGLHDCEALHALTKRMHREENAGRGSGLSPGFRLEVVIRRMEGNGSWHGMINSKPHLPSSVHHQTEVAAQDLDK